MGIFDIFNTNNTAGRDAASANDKSLWGAWHESRNMLQKGADDATGYYNQADSYYKPLYDNALRGSNMYSNALGLNGADGNSAAVSAYQTNPGYQFALDQGLTAVNRKAARGGMLSSGNTMMALNDYARGIANQDYSSWLDRLKGLGSDANSLAGARAGISTNLANMNYNMGNTLAGYRMNNANTVANQTYSGSVADQQAKNTASGNIFGALMGGANLGLKATGWGGFGLPGK